MNEIEYVPLHYLEPMPTRLTSQILKAFEIKQHTRSFIYFDLHSVTLNDPYPTTGACFLHATAQGCDNFTFLVLQSSFL